MKLWLGKARRGNAVGLVATDDSSRTALARITDGECVQVEIVRPRSIQWNKLYWALCRTIGENQDPSRDEDSIDLEVRILSGHYEVMHVEGYEVRVPKRLAFEKMDADQWAEYWQRAELAISERFGSEYITQQHWHAA